MSKQDKFDTTGGAYRGDEALESLFRHADVRPRPPADLEHEVRGTLHGEWRAMTARIRRRRIAAWGLAASVVLAVALVLLPQRSAELPAQVLASVARIDGELLLRGIDDPRNATVQFTGKSLFAGQVLITDDHSRAGLTWHNGESIRLDQRTELALYSDGMLELRNGTVYVDSQGAVGKGFVIRTPAGDVRHIGTQYLADVNKGTLTVSVREGRVKVVDEVAAQGQQLTLDQRGQVGRNEIESYGPLWSWTELVAPQITLDGMTALAFVEWAARQTGREVSFADDQTRELAAGTILRGTVQLEPARALELILQTSDLEHVIVNGEIQVSTRPRS
ncbi:MAG: FecR domain-containing protein [Xanthomonadales bacterium]|nr:FecR family protein [Gammaproteobacteria bacterium]NNE06091.1 FecR domain-containing protein [Xanthomonadales bacterium]NNL94897.1 FecR domain-containing protein [Xanthomonadales bacterium]